MAKRQKFVSKFDFSGMKYLDNPVDYLFDKLKPEEIIAETETVMAERTTNNAYVGRWITTCIANAKAAGWDKVGAWEKKTIGQFLFEKTTKYRQEYNALFLEWYKTHEGARELYEACSPHLYWWTENNLAIDVQNERSHTGEDAKVNGWTLAPRDYIDFSNTVQHYEARKYVETNREQIFEEGDVVVLRLPYVGRYDYDPFCRNANKARTDKRYGTVMEQGSGDFEGYRYGHGSRTIKVLWFGHNEAMDMPERAIKFESRKGRRTSS